MSGDGERRLPVCRLRVVRRSQSDVVQLPFPGRLHTLRRIRLLPTGSRLRRRTSDTFPVCLFAITSFPVPTTVIRLLMTYIRRRLRRRHGYWGWGRVDWSRDLHCRPPC